MPDTKKEDFKDAEWMADVWRNERSVEELHLKILSGTFSARDIVTLKLLEGDKRLMTKFMDKLIPDLNRQVDENLNDVYIPLTDQQRALLASRGFIA